MKICTACKIEKPLSDFGLEKGKPNGRKARCKPCARKSNKASYDKNPSSRVAATLRWKANNPAHVKGYMAERRLRIKADLVAGYGGKCTCCGETSIEFLTLEHLNGGGRAHRAVKDSLGIFNEVIRAGFPKEYTILCMNCNFAKRFGKECPHATTGTNAAKIDALVKALERVIRDINEYERVNNLAPNPGRTECWDSVAEAKALLRHVGRGQEP
jgi:hypothetical protein